MKLAWNLSFGQVSAEFRIRFGHKFRPSFGQVSAKFRKTFCFGQVSAKFRIRFGRPCFGQVSAKFWGIWEILFRIRFGCFGYASEPLFRPSCSQDICFGQVSAEFRTRFRAPVSGKFRPSFGGIWEISVSVKFRPNLLFRASFGQVSSKFRFSFLGPLRL